MKQIKFRVIENQKKSKYYIQIRGIFRWKYLSQTTGSNAGYSWKTPIEFSTREAAVNHLRFHQDRSKGRFHEFAEYPGIKIS